MTTASQPTTKCAGEAHTALVKKELHHLSQQSHEACTASRAEQLEISVDGDGAALLGTDYQMRKGKDSSASHAGVANVRLRGGFMRHIPPFLRIWLCAVFAVWPLVAAAQQATGTIGGTVQDASGAVMPGVTLALSNPGVINGNQTTVTSDRGTYQFVRLVPGTYSVRAELQGFRPVQRENILVDADVTVRIDITIEIGSVEESVNVAGVAPLLDTSTTQHQTLVDRKTMDAIPSGNALWSIGAVVPSLVQSVIDIGGVQAFQESTPKVHGSLRDENRWLIDGMDVGYGGGNGASVAYYDTMMMEEINYQTGQSPAENQQGGVVMNMVTKTGTNVFHVSANTSGSREGLMSTNISPDQLRSLQAGLPAAIVRVNPTIVPSNAVPWIYDLAASVTGPIIRDKLWFAVTTRHQAVDQIATGSYNPDGSLGHENNLMRNYSANASWQVNHSNTLKVLIDNNQKTRFHRRGDFAGAAFQSDAATTIQYLTPKIFQARWASVLSPRFLLDVSGSSQSGAYTRTPQPGVNPSGTIPQLDLVTQVGSVAASYYADIQQSNRGLYASLSFFSGTHSLKAGFQAARYSAATHEYSTALNPSGFVAVYRNGVPNSVQEFNTPFDNQSVALSQSYYVQDKWTPTRKLTLNLGLRLQHITGYIPAECQPQTVFIAGQCFSRIDDVPNWLDLSPRFGLVYDVFGNGKTAAKLGANRYMVGTAGGYGATINPVHESISTCPWTDTNSDGTPQLSEFAQARCTGFALGTTSRYAAGVTSPQVYEGSVEIEQQMPRDVVLSVAYFRRAIRNNLGVRNMLVPTSSYIPLAVTEMSSGRQVTVYNQNPARRGLFDNVYANYPEMNGDFNGVDFNFRKRMSHGWMVIGGVAYGRNTGDTYGNIDLNNPNYTFRQGLMTNTSAGAGDVPWNAKVSGVYEAPLGLRLSGSYQFYSGFPESTTVQVTAATVALTQVNQTVRVDPTGSTRLPDSNVVHLRISKVLRFAGRGQITPGVDIFNLFNANTIQSRATQLGPAYGQINSILQARMLRFSCDMTF